MYLMYKFKVGEKAKLKAWQCNSLLKDVICVVEGFITYSGNRIVTLKNTDVGPNLILGNKVTEYESELIPMGLYCPVCNNEIEIENNKIKKHNHNNEVCYGSYTPHGI